jgi:site-specific DNA recombinase
MNQDVLEQAILTSLKKHLMDSELCKVFCDEYTRDLNQVSRHRHQIMAKYRAEYAKLLQVKERIIKAVTEGWDTPDMKAELENNYKRRQELETLIEQKEDTAPVMLHPSMAEYYRQEVGQLISSLNQPETRSEAAQLLRKLIDKILLTPNDTGDALRVDLHGDLVGILHMATHCKALSEEDHPLVHHISMMTGYQDKEKDTMKKKNALTIKQTDVSRPEWLRG